MTTKTKSKISLHHINGNKNDNSVENLIFVDPANHV
jgi:hypothetical protein